MSFSRRRGLVGDLANGPMLRMETLNKVHDG